MTRVLCSCDKDRGLLRWMNVGEEDDSLEQAPQSERRITKEIGKYAERRKETERDVERDVEREKVVLKITVYAGGQYK